MENMHYFGAIVKKIYTSQGMDAKGPGTNNLSHVENLQLKCHRGETFGVWTHDLFRLFLKLLIR